MMQEERYRIFIAFDDAGRNPVPPVDVGLMRTLHDDLDGTGLCWIKCETQPVGRLVDIGVDGKDRVLGKDADFAPAGIPGNV